MSRTRVALVASAESSFVSTDRRILDESFAVRYVHWYGKRSIPTLALAVIRSDVVFSWFALDHAYGACRLARLFGRRSVVVVGGGDAAKRPDLSYGIYLNPARGRRSAYAIAHSDRVLVVDDSLRGELEENSGVRRDDIITVPLGFDTERLCPGGGPRTTVLTVGLLDELNFRRKGGETFVEAARLLPELAFAIVGASDRVLQRLRSHAPPNVRISGRLSSDELLNEFRRARVYAQLSDYEAFGSALGEAMSCGCIPVGTRVGGIPTLIGDTGVYTPVGDAERAAEAIREAFTHGDGRAARARIVENFPIERRRRVVTSIVKNLATA